MRVTSKGQVTIPKPVRDRLGIRPGSEVAFEEEDGRFYLVRADNLAYWKTRIDRVRGAADGGLSTAEIMRMTRGEDWDDGAPPHVAD
jgi:AbrB family looped-hinge helix DNA binding protein